MKKYLRRTITITAINWRKKEDSSLEDGVLVQPYNTDKSHTCIDCNKEMRKHGWIDPRNHNLINGQNLVCPGDWIIIQSINDINIIEIMSPAVFEQRYEELLKESDY